MGKYKKIYVLAPYQHSTGGVELAHQLVDHLRNLGQQAHIVYVDKSYQVVDCDQVTSTYSKYNIAVASKILDSEDNYLMLPEIYFDFALQYEKINIGCWWMSVDNRYKHISFPGYFKTRNGFYEKVRSIKHFFIDHSLSFKNSDALLRELGDRVTHFYQSVYAQHAIYEKGFSRCQPLSDFINCDLVGTATSDKEDIILYNPAKGYEYTKKIIDRIPEYNFVPLKGLNRDQLREILSKAKLYIDFGNFPGKDRLPREAVMNGCCIITGKSGASYYYEDVPINGSYKFEAKESNLPKIVSRIRDVMADYENCSKDFDSYRGVVRKEKDIFYKEIESIFI